MEILYCCSTIISWVEFLQFRIIWDSNTLIRVYYLDFRCESPFKSSTPSSQLAGDDDTFIEIAQKNGAKRIRTGKPVHGWVQPWHQLSYPQKLEGGREGLKTEMAQKNDESSNKNIGKETGEEGGTAPAAHNTVPGTLECPVVKNYCKCRPLLSCKMTCSGFRKAYHNFVTCQWLG